MAKSGKKKDGADRLRLVVADRGKLYVRDVYLMYGGGDGGWGLWLYRCEVPTDTTLRIATWAEAVGIEVRREPESWERPN